jgi:hypothetical protein
LVRNHIIFGNTMRLILLIALSLVVAGCSRTKAPSEVDHDQHELDHHEHHGAAHQHSMLMVTTDPLIPIAGDRVALKLMIHTPEGTMVDDFDIVHEKQVHLMIVREGLDEFAHVHPAVDDQGNLSISHTFSKAGKYRFYADYKPRGESPALATAQIEVTGEPSPAPALVVNAPGEVTADGLVAQVELNDAKGGQESEIRFRLANEAGQAIDNLQPYLGARGHLVVISADGEQYVHAHPVDAPTAANEIVFLSHYRGRFALYLSSFRFVDVCMASCHRLKVRDETYL